MRFVSSICCIADWWVIIKNLILQYNCKPCRCRIIWKLFRWQHAQFQIWRNYSASIWWFAQDRFLLCFCPFFDSHVDILIMKLKPYKSKWNDEIPKPRIFIFPGFRSVISTRIQLTTSRIAKPSTKSCCWFRLVFKLMIRIRIGCHKHQSEQWVWKCSKSSIKQMSQQAWSSFQHRLHQASKNHCFNNLTKRNKFNEETILVLEWFNFSTVE